MVTSSDAKWGLTVLVTVAGLGIGALGLWELLKQRPPNPSPQVPDVRR